MCLQQVITVLATLVLYFPLQAHVPENITTLLKPLQQKASVALIVTDLKSPQKTILSIQPEQYLLPASIQKILTSIIATSSLEAVRPFQTTMQAYGDLKNTTLTGQITLETGANPNFDSQTLDLLIKTLQQRGINTIKGSIEIIKSHFDSMEKTPGTTWDEVDDCYATATSDISLNQNCFMLSLVRLGKNIIPYSPQSEQPIHLEIDLDDQCNDQKNTPNHFPAQGYGILLKQNPFKTPETLKGCWQPQHRKLVLKRSLHSPEKSLVYAIQEVLSTNKVTLQGSININASPFHSNRKPLWTVTIPSQSRQDLIKTMLEKSHNHIANQLFKEAAFQQTGQQATWESAQKHAQIVLEKYHLDDPRASIVDGAGLSRNNRINAMQIQRSLTAIYQNPSLQHLLTLFPSQKTAKHPLSRRLSKIKTPIFAKTGSLKNVISLAGYIDPHGPHPKAFTLIINGHKDIHKDYLAIETDLLEAIDKL